MAVPRAAGTSAASRPFCHATATGTTASRARPYEQSKSTPKAKPPSECEPAAARCGRWPGSQPQPTRPESGEEPVGARRRSTGRSVRWRRRASPTRATPSPATSRVRVRHRDHGDRAAGDAEAAAHRGPPSPMRSSDQRIEHEPRGMATRVGCVLPDVVRERRGGSGAASRPRRRRRGTRSGCRSRAATRTSHRSRSARSSTTPLSARRPPHEGAPVRRASSGRASIASSAIASTMTGKRASTDAWVVHRVERRKRDLHHVMRTRRALRPNDSLRMRARPAWPRR